MKLFVSTQNSRIEGLSCLLARLLDLLGLDLGVYQPIPLRIKRRSTYEYQKRI